MARRNWIALWRGYRPRNREQEPNIGVDSCWAESPLDPASLACRHDGGAHDGRTHDGGVLPNAVLRLRRVTVEMGVGNFGENTWAADAPALRPRMAGAGADLRPSEQKRIRFIAYEEHLARRA